ncbi:restriction endonuclease subunit S [Bacillus safensis]|uniref:restriction endonuclease subunit S n=1 Tax=Bacillus safensis TaxID=561879 RepID=UPI002040AD7B|nr:restriction endonuclease subunit S [Bacillus safensis]MCM3028093.1 restriction endonuclease subunit S [Bacillus safensis]
MIYNEKWPLKKLNECCEYISRGKQPKYVEFSEVKTLNQKAIQWGIIDKKALKYHNPEIVVDKKHFILKDDIVLNSTGTGTVGRCYYFSEQPTENFFADSHVTIIRTKKDVLLPAFLYYQLSTTQYQDLIYSRFLAGSTGQVELNKSKVQEFPVYTPDVNIQEKIVNILKVLDEKIKNNTKSIATLEQLTQTIFKQWFIDFEFPNEEGKPYKSSGRELVESELGEIPKDWVIGKAGNILEFSPIEKIAKNKTATFVEMKNLNTSAMVYEYIQKPFKSGSKFRNGDTLLARITPCLENGKIGFVDFLNENEVGWGSTEFITIRTKNNIASSFSYYFASEQNFKNYAIKNMNGSSGRQRVKAETLINYLIAIPPNELIKKFTDISEPNMQMMTKLKEETLILRKVRDTLLPKLLSGEIEIPNDLEV